MQKQLISIHGGGSFIPKHGESMLDIIQAKEPSLEKMRHGVGWKALLQQNLGDRYDVLSPKMPNADAPRYEEWKVWFEKILPLLNRDAIFVGHSLGAMFLAKYFSESPKLANVPALFLVAPPYEALGYAWEFTDISPLMGIVDNIFIYHSKDDEVVPFESLEKFKEKLPNATVRELDGRGHFNGEEFHELITDIQSIS